MKKIFFLRLEEAGRVSFLYKAMIDSRVFQFYIHHRTKIYRPCIFYEGNSD